MLSLTVKLSARAVLNQTVSRSDWFVVEFSSFNYCAQIILWAMTRRPQPERMTVGMILAVA